MHQAGLQTPVKTMWRKNNNKFSAIHGILILPSWVVYTPDTAYVSKMNLRGYCLLPNHKLKYCYYIITHSTVDSFLEVLLGFSPIVHIPQIKSETVFFFCAEDLSPSDYSN